MAPPAIGTEEPAQALSRSRLALFWLAGIDLRITVLCLPPVIPLIHHDLRLDEKQIGLLTGSTPLLLALFAIPGSLLIAKLGARRALAAGLVLVAAAGALRGFGPSVSALVLMTLLMGLGISVIQPAFPTLARVWFPGRSGVATAVYSNGLLVGEVIPAALTLALVLPLAGGSWEWALAFWSLPLIATVALVLLATPHVQRASGGPPARWWPSFGDPQTWVMGLAFGCGSALYWSANAFLPDYFHATGRGTLVQAGLTALNLFQLPASLLVALFARRMVGHRWPLAGSGVAMSVAVAGFLLMPGYWGVVWAAVFGLTAAMTLVLTLALAPLLAAPGDAHRLSAGMFTITYTLSFLAPVAGGIIWDATGIPAAAFSPGAAAGLALIFLALALKLPDPETRPLLENRPSKTRA